MTLRFAWCRVGVFNPVPLVIRDELQKATLDDENNINNYMTVLLQQKIGLTVYEGEAVDEQPSVMKVVIDTTKRSASLWKIVNHAESTIFKIFQNGNSYDIKAVNNSATSFSVDKRRKLKFLMLNVMGFLFENGEYKITKNGNEVAVIWPKISQKRNIYFVEFADDSLDFSSKSAVLGFALLLMVEFAYPELKRLLKQSMKQP